MRNWRNRAVATVVAIFAATAIALGLGATPASAQYNYSGCPTSGYWVCLYDNFDGSGILYLVSTVGITDRCYNMPSSWNDRAMSALVRGYNVRFYENAGCPHLNGWAEYWEGNPLATYGNFSKSLGHWREMTSFWVYPN